MSTTGITDIQTSVPEVWARTTLRETLEDSFWAGMRGPEGSGMPIIVKTELLDRPGDIVHIQVTNPLSGAGVEGDEATLEGQEEALSTSEILCATVLRRHAVRNFVRADKRSILDLYQEARMRLREWGAEKMDDVRFARFLADSLPAPLNGETYNAPNTYVAGGLAARTDITTDGGGALTVEDIQKLKVKARIQRMKPVRMGGRSFYAMVTHPYALHLLKREQEYRDWVKDAHERGESNPFFRGSTAVIDGVVLFDHPNVPVSASGHAVPEDVADSIFFGAEAFVEALDQNVRWKREEFDYGNQEGVAYSFAFDCRRALELSSIRVYAAAPTV